MKKAVILVNLGTPATTDVKDIRRFLRQFLSDQRVVELPRLIWYPILYGIILPFRARRLQEPYSELWQDGESPLRSYSMSIVDQLQKSYGDELSVHLAMTYGEPSIGDVLERCHNDGVENILVLPMYPQYSATTTAAVFDQIAQHYLNRRCIPQWQMLSDYYREPLYIKGLAKTVRQHWQEHGQGELLLVSFHGIPKRCVDLGDPYYEQCQATAKALANELGLSDSQWMLSFQSRLGKAEWLQPYTDKVLEQLGGEGLQTLDVICPAFATECLETLDEIAIEGQEQFTEAGGGTLRYVPCLNDNSDQIALLKNLIDKNFGA